MIRDLINGLTPEYAASGIYDYNDAATAITPLSVSAGLWTSLPNDGAGPATNKNFSVPGVPEVWDTTNNQFDFSGLSLGDNVVVRVDTEVTTNNNNQELEFRLQAAIGGASYTVEMHKTSYKDSGAHDVGFLQMIYMGDENTLKNPAELQIYSAKACDVLVRGWAFGVTLRTPKYKV